MAIFLKLGDIKGSSTDHKFKEQIELHSFQWGAGIPTSNSHGGDRTTGKASVAEISATKQTDKATEKLFKSLLTGQPVGKGVISFVSHSGQKESIAYATLTIEDVIVSGLSFSADSNNIPSEHLSLNFTKFDWSFTGRDSKQGGQPTHLIYDIVESRVV